MDTNLTLTLGLVFDIIGVIILTLVSIIDYSHQRIYGEKEWWKKYWWMGRVPIYRDTKTFRLKIKLNRKIVIYGFIPPKIHWETIGLIFILIGFFLQLMIYLT